MTLAALLTSISLATATPPSRARGLTGESPDLKPGRELYWERKGGGWVLRPGLPPTLPPPQSQPRPLSWPLPFSSFGFFLMWGWISWRGRWPPRGGGHHRACGGWEGVYRPQHVGRGMLETARPPRWVWQESQPGAEGGTRVGEQGSSEQGDKARHPQGDQVRLGEPAGATGTAGQSVAAFHAHAPHPLTQWPLPDSASCPVPSDHESRLLSVAGASLPGSQSAHPEQRCNSSSGWCPRSSACPLP